MPISYSAQTLTIEGADAIAFAQAQFSSNLATLAVGHWQFSAWLDAQGLARATLLGHSMGGKTAMLLACRQPERVERRPSPSTLPPTA